MTLALALPPPLPDRYLITAPHCLQDAKWIMFEGMSDVTFRRQRAAVNGLGKLLSRRHGAQDQAPSPDEVNVIAMQSRAEQSRAEQSRAEQSS